VTTQNDSLDDSSLNLLEFCSVLVCPALSLRFMSSFATKTNNDDSGKLVDWLANLLPWKLKNMQQNVFQVEYGEKAGSRN